MAPPIQQQQQQQHQQPQQQNVIQSIRKLLKQKFEHKDNDSSGSSKAEKFEHIERIFMLTGDPSTTTRSSRSDRKTKSNGVQPIEHVPMPSYLLGLPKGRNETTTTTTTMKMPVPMPLPMPLPMPMRMDIGDPLWSGSCAQPSLPSPPPVPFCPSQKRLTLESSSSSSSSSAAAAIAAPSTSKSTQKISKSYTKVVQQTPPPLDVVRIVTIRARRLMKEFEEVKRVNAATRSIFTAELIDDNLQEWIIKLDGIDTESLLASDMRELNIPYIKLHLSFPDNYPFSPPFMRVVEPFIERGFVMIGGAICMELLTPKGWASAYTIEAVIIQFAASLVKGQARISRTVKKYPEFNKTQAEYSFRAIVKTHEKYGWVTPSLADG